jgi:hypothetical protein
VPLPAAHPDLFGVVPFGWLGGRLIERLAHRRWVLALAVAGVAWVPLALLAAFEGLALTENPRESFLLDVAAFGRYVIAAPILILAAMAYIPQLSMVAAQFVEGDLITESDRPRFDALLASTRRWLDSRWSDGALLLLAYAVTLLLSRVLYPAQLSTWVAPVTGGRQEISLAGWWRLLVSQPLFLVLCATALWRIALWVRFLCGVARLDLRLVASHPDRAGGLRFVTIPLQGFALVALAGGVVGASSIAESMLFDGRPLAEFRHLIGATVLVVLLVFVGPLLALSGPLVRLKNHATCHYGRLASAIGWEFQAKWLGARRATEAEGLVAPDFSATTDLFSVTQNVHQITPFIADLRICGGLALATLLPYVPLLFLQMPFDDVVRLLVQTVL